MDQNKIWDAAGVSFGPIVISSIHQWITKATEHTIIPILFPDDTSILITSPNNIQLQNDLNIVLAN